MNKTRSLIAALPFALLAACGGGGGGDSGTASGGVAAAAVNVPVTNANGQTGTSAAAEQAAPAFPVDSVMAALIDAPRAYTKTYTDPAGDVYTLVGKYTPDVRLSFEGTPARAGFSTTSRRKNGALTWMSSQIDYYRIDSNRYLGSIVDTGEYIVADNQAQTPATAKIGDAGNLYTFTSYSNISKATVVHTGSATWELQADTGSTAYLCLKLQSNDARNGSSSVTSACNKIDANGLVAGSRIIVADDGNTMTFSD
jgi:hypothetical protein